MCKLCALIISEKPFALPWMSIILYLVSYPQRAYNQIKPYWRSHSIASQFHEKKQKQKKNP